MKTTKFSATASQKALAHKIMKSLQERQMTILTGREDGKTRVHYSVVGALGIYDQREIYRHIYPHGERPIVAKTQHSEDPDVIILPSVKLHSQTINPQRAIRQIMGSCGVSVPHYLSADALDRRWNDLLIDLYSRNIILAIAVDNAELLPGKAFGVIKELNELQVKKMDVGIAALIAGQTHRMKCDLAFRRHSIEHQVGKITVEEMLQLVQTHFPIEAPSFTRPVLERISKEETVLDMIHLARRLVETKRENRLPKIDNDVLILAKAA